MVMLLDRNPEILAARREGAWGSYMVACSEMGHSRLRYTERCLETQVSSSCVWGSQYTHSSLTGKTHKALTPTPDINSIPPIISGTQRHRTEERPACAW